MQFRILGPLEIRLDDDKVLAVPQARHRQILSTLLLLANRPVKASTLVEALWGSDAPRAVGTTLRSHISTLRQLSSHFVRLETHSASYMMRVPDRELDVAMFHRWKAEGQESMATADHATAATALSRALAMWREPSFHDLPSIPELDRLSTQLLHERRSVHQSWLDARLALGDHHELVAHIRTMIEEEPLDEHLWSQLMLALYRSGRQAEALGAFTEIRSALAADCGVDPSHELIDLQRRILARDSALDLPSRLLTPGTIRPWPQEITGPAHPARRPPAAQEAQFPSPVRPFVGREDLVASIVTGLTTEGGQPVTTVTGPAGSGKTALVLEVAHRTAEHFPDGRVFVDIASSTASPVRETTGLRVALTALGTSVEDVPDSVVERRALLKSMLGGRTVLLVVDDAGAQGWEHMIDPRPGGSVVLVTRRRPLDRPRGKSVALRSLSAHDAELLLCALVPARPVGDTRAGLRRLATKCGPEPAGIIRVAAALTRRPEWTIAVVEDLDSWRPPTVRGGMRSERMYDIEVVHAALRPRTRHLLDVLSRLVKGDFAEWVVAAAIGEHPADEMLTELGELHLIRHQQQAGGTGPRYELLDDVREFVLRSARGAASRVSDHDWEVARRRILTAWLELADLADQSLPRPTGSLPSPRIARRTVLPDPLARDLVRDPVAWFHAEQAGLAHAVEAAAAGGDLVVAAQFVSYQVAHLYFQNRLADAIRLWDDIAAYAVVARQPDAEARARFHQAAIWFQDDDVTAARECLDQAMKVLETAGETTDLALAHYLRSRDATASGRPAQARRHARRGLAIARRVQDGFAELMNLAMLGTASVELGHVRAGRLYCLQMAMLARRLQEPSYEWLAANLLDRLPESA